MKIKEITDYLEEIAPLSYQEEYDNSGLLVGSKCADVEKMLITLDCTEEVIDEAISKKCNLIICHHPIIFSGLKQINGSDYIQRAVIKAIKSNIAIYAIHTNLDNIYNGVSSTLAAKLGLKNCTTLAPKEDLLRQLVLYCPLEHSSYVKEALFNAGAGALGNYQRCSFSLLGNGTFEACNGANPFVGNIDELHTHEEERIEVLYPVHKERSILSAMRETHPYEEIAYQIYTLRNKNRFVGPGIIGELDQSYASMDFLHQIKDLFQTDCIRYTNLVKKKIKKVAVCGGSGSFLLPKAVSSGADIFITADFRYHDFFNADNNIIIADIGHYESEQFTKDLIYNFLIKKFAKFAVLLSKVNTNPINYL